MQWDQISVKFWFVSQMAKDVEFYFHIGIGHLYFFIWKLLILFIFPFFVWIIFLFGLIFSVFNMFWILIPSQMIADKDFLPFCRLSLCCVLSFCCAEDFQDDAIPLVNCCYFLSYSKWHYVCLNLRVCTLFFL
jgi:hypothetical protein